MRRIAIVLGLLMVLGSTSAPASVPGVGITLTGPTLYDAGVPVTFSGRLSVVGTAGIPAQGVEIVVDGVPAATAATALDGAYSTQVTFSASAPFSHSVEAVAFGGTAAETRSAAHTIQLRVVLTSITISPASPSVIEGLTKAFTATGSYNDGSVADITAQALWSSSNPATATISNTPATKGLATGVAPGSTTITAQKDSLTGSTSLTVLAKTLTHVTVTPAAPTIRVGETIPLTATAFYDNGTTQIVNGAASWVSSQPGVVQSTGNLAKGLAPGTANVKATFQSKFGEAAVTVVPPPTLVINEVDYDQPGTDVNEFIEIYNPGTAAADLSGIAVVLVNGADGNEYGRISLSGSLPAGGYAVIKSAGVTVPGGTVTFPFAASSNNVQNGAPDGIVIWDTLGLTVIDSLSYEGSITSANITGAPGTYNLVRGTATSAIDTGVGDGSLARLPNGASTGNDAADWSSTSTPTPGAANA